ncbi:MAG: hypothetical protein EAZ19_17095 [Oscillatoriales cyanobacterium]|nr:MAG: hypothetical protein EAZ94_17560 [Oscillatoriales cyanobacterium]TAE22454.1 MAG: hypothetical protein EAZ93_18145 [Oscillatoriales cyanobacterium]TAE48731.1 MAG: hypothetical protein EAZ88_23630 [Oscillatoriales cyanobacterium]TAF89249.1 MAG: hypothetical protein EAZ49_13475 [Oscillatoriales cyanobacterium]TAF98956.1 MAG: hypothetical protein EAZ45_18900 [Oscillatoriales cyanobacterium]
MSLINFIKVIIVFLKIQPRNGFFYEITKYSLSQKDEVLMGIGQTGQIGHWANRPNRVYLTFLIKAIVANTLIFIFSSTYFYS